MKRIVLAAAMLMAGAAAQAESFSFNVEGHKVRINVPRDCASLSCISVSAPSLVNKIKEFADEAEPSSAAARPAPAPVTAATAPAAVQNPGPASAAVQPSAASAPVAPTAATPPVPTSPQTPTPPASETTAAPAPAPGAPVTVAAAPAAPAATATASPAPARLSPIGLWMAEKKQGQIRIEDCNGHLCGYAVNAKSGANGEKVLVNMKPDGDKWVGRIKDTRKGGGTYDSTIALRGSDRLRVQGCAFGGLFCGGETWTRVE